MSRAKRTLNRESPERRRGVDVVRRRHVAGRVDEELTIKESLGKRNRELQQCLLDADQRRDGMGPTQRYVAVRAVGFVNLTCTSPGILSPRATGLPS